MRKKRKNERLSIITAQSSDTPWGPSPLTSPLRHPSRWDGRAGIEKWARDRQNSVLPALNFKVVGAAVGGRGGRTSAEGSAGLDR